MAELKVTITDDRGETSENVIPVQKETTDPTKAVQQATPKTPESKENNSKSTGLAIASMVGSRAFNYMTSNVGKYSGNSRNQQALNNAMQVGSMLAMAYVSPALAVASTAITAATTGIDIAYEKKWNDKESALRLAKAGYNSSGEVVGRRH